MNTFRLFCIVLLSLSILSGCKKDEAPSPSSSSTAANNSTQLSNHYWRMSFVSGVQITPPSDSVFSYQLPAYCQTDDHFYFNTNGYFVFDPDSIDCGESADSVTWVYSQNHSHVIIIDGNDSTDFQITSLTQNKLLLFNRVELGGGAFELDTLGFVYP